MYSDTNPEFWKFSLDEYMKIDLPNTVDYILSTTGFKQVGGVTTRFCEVSSPVNPV